MLKKSLADMPSEVLENILSQLLPEDLMLITYTQRGAQQEASYQNPNLTTIKKLRLTGDKKLISSLESDPRH